MKACEMLLDPSGPLDKECGKTCVGFTEDGVRVCAECAKGMEREQFRVAYFSLAGCGRSVVHVTPENVVKCGVPYVCEECRAALARPQASAPGDDAARAFSLNEFHRVNDERQREAFAPPHPLMALVACVQEEVGELAAAVLGVTGEKKRKAHLTNADVLDAVADAMTYLSLVASNVGCMDLETLLADTFNMVSERAGSKLRVTRSAPPAGVAPMVPCSCCGKPTEMPKAFRVWCSKACADRDSEGTWRAPT